MASFSQLDDDHSDITEEPLDNIHTPHPTTPGRRRHDDEPIDPLLISPHLQRLIDWNVDMLGNIIQTIVATRDIKRGNDHRYDNSQNLVPQHEHNGCRPPPTLIMNSNPRNEYCEGIQMPSYDPSCTPNRPSEVIGCVNHLDETVRNQLKDLITTIACAYNDNPFHNFEHAR